MKPLARKAPAALSLLVLIAIAAMAGTTAHTKLYSFQGSTSGKIFGLSVGGAGDVDQDGYDDLIVGAPWESSSLGRAYVYSGKDGKQLYSYTGSAVGNLGNSVCGAGDVDRDGYDDFFIGYRYDPKVGSQAGSATLHSGKTGTAIRTFYGGGASDMLGFSVGHAGDVNADGYPDQIVGAKQIGVKSGGFARVFSGKDGSVLYTFSPSGIDSNAQFGHHVDGAGDVNKDGYDDVIVGAWADLDPSGTCTGSAWVFSGKDGTTLFTRYGDTGNDHFGGSVGGAGDVNNDGYADYVVGTSTGWPGTPKPNTGYARVFSGKDGKVIYTWKGGSSTDNFGWGVCGLGDINGDGYDDIAVTASYNDGNGTDCGAAHVYSGYDGSLLFSLFGGAGDRLGDSLGDGVSCAGDVNGDGAPDLIVGASKIDTACVYVSAGPIATLSIDDGAVATNSSQVTLHVSVKGSSANLAEMRFRNVGDSWSNWQAFASTADWTLSAGEGIKEVEAQVRSASGTTSAAFADSIILDQTPPIGTVAINRGAATTSVPWVTLALEYTDLQSGVTEVRLRNAGQFWGPWEYVDETKPWTIPAVGGLHTVEVQYRDAAGNVSEVAADTIEYLPDVVAPKITTVRLCDNQLYVCPEQEFRVLVHAMDDASGSGLDAYRFRMSPGGSWSDWISYSGGPEVTIPRPELVGPVSVEANARDQIGNESDPAKASTYLLKRNPSWLGAGGKGGGSISAVGDIDAFTLGLVKGDALNVRPQTRAGEKKKDLVLDLDVVGLAGEKFLVGGYPEDAGKPGITGWVVPETGRYLVVLRVARDNSASSGTYSLKVKVRQARSNKRVKSEYTGTEMTFDAVAGSKFKALLAGEGVDPAGVTLIGPDGPVAIEVAGKPGKVKVKGVLLSAGTGTYTIRLASPATVAAKWSVKLPKIKGTVGE